MITNLFILDRDGHTVLAHNFGACNSFGVSPDVISGFLSAVHSFGMMLSGNDVSEIRLGQRCFYLTVDKLILVLVSDDHNDDDNRQKLEIIHGLLDEQYSSIIDGYLSDGDSSRFEFLPQLLIDKGILQKNCSGMSDCTDCEDNGKNFPIEPVERMLRTKIDSSNH